MNKHCFFCSVIISLKDTHDYDSLMAELQECPMKILVVRKEGAGPAEHLADVVIVLEGQEVMNGINNVPKAVVLLLGLIYAIDLSYPSDLKYFFEAVQRIFLNLDSGKMSSKVHALKSKLFS